MHMTVCEHTFLNVEGDPLERRVVGIRRVDADAGIWCVDVEHTTRHWRRRCQSNIDVKEGEEIRAGSRFDLVTRRCGRRRWEPSLHEDYMKDNNDT